MSQFDFNFSTPVEWTDGQQGKLAGLVVNPADWQVTDLIVKKGFLRKQARLLPLSLVKTATPDHVQLTVSTGEFEQYPRYRQIEYEEPASGGETSGGVFSSYDLYGSTKTPPVPMVKKKLREGILAGQRVIEPRMPLKNIEGTMGAVDQVWVDSNREVITDLVVGQGTFLSGEQLVIPMPVVESVTEDEIFVTFTREELSQILAQVQPDPAYKQEPKGL